MKIRHQEFKENEYKQSLMDTMAKRQQLKQPNVINIGETATVQTTNQPASQPAPHEMMCMHHQSHSSPSLILSPSVYRDYRKHQEVPRACGYDTQR
jgi:hypothetical protein